MVRALVTGADGFIGSHLVEHLLNEGYRVTALSQYNSFNDLGWLECVAKHDALEVVCGDIRDLSFCEMITSGVDVVFHLAALIAIPYSYVAPQSYVATNVGGTLNMCQAALKAGVSRFVHTSTSEVYGTAKYVPIDEGHPLQGQSPYSASKIGADAIVDSFGKSFDLPITIARPFNTYGPRQSARAVIPSIIIQIAAGAEQIVLGDLTPTRDFNYVEDTCKGFQAVSECNLAIGRTINIGSNSEISVGDTLALIKELMNSDVEFVQDEARVRPRNSEVFRLVCDNSLIKRLTEFRSEVDLVDGLSRTIQWFSLPENLRRYKSQTYNL